ncbi:MAG: hypothetical protein ABUL44_01550, partial [Flavobacterium sp.]
MKLTYKFTILLCIGSMLLNSCSSDDSTQTDSVSTETATLKTFKDVTFSLDQSEGYDAGLYFSTELGKSFKTSKFDATILPKIDIAFYSANYALNYFMSPNNDDYGVKGAPLTLFINVQKDLLTIEQF